MPGSKFESMRSAWRKPSLAILIALGLWVMTLSLMITHLGYLSFRSDWLVRLDQVLSLIAIVGGLLLLLGNLRMVWSGARRWPAKTWSVVLVIAAASVLWVALAVHLIGWGVDY